MSELSVGQLKGLTVNNNIIRVPSGHTLYAPGHVIQTVSTAKVDSFSTTSSTYVDVPGISLSIIPKLSTSKIYVTVSMNISGNSSAWGFVQLYRDSTAIHMSTSGGSANATYSANLASSAAAEMVPLTISYIDSPNTTNSTTYKIMIKNNDGTNPTSVNKRASDANLGSVSSIVLMEIAQ